MRPRRRAGGDTPQGPGGDVPGEDAQLAAHARAIVIHPNVATRPTYPLGQPNRQASGGRTSAARLDEAVGLARALELEVVSSGIVNVTRARPAPLLGSGKVDELAGLVRAEHGELVVVDATLSPVQQRNLEKEWKVKILDRTGLILEIFGDRAATREGVLQVEMAALSYQRTRLVRARGRPVVDTDPVCEDDYAPVAGEAAWSVPPKAGEAPEPPPGG